MDDGQQWKCFCFYGFKKKTIKRTFTLGRKLTTFSYINTEHKRKKNLIYSSKKIFLYKTKMNVEDNLKK